MNAPALESARIKHSPPRYEQPGAGAAMWAMRACGVALLALLAAVLPHYPGAALAVALLALYAGLLWVQPRAWLFVVPAVLPVVDFAPWTGWFFIDELDFVLAVTVIVVAWRAPVAHKSELAPGAGVLFGLLGAVWFLSLLIGVLPLDPIDKSIVGNYYTKYNALRVGKGFFWVLLLWPLMRRCAGRDLAALERYFFPGVLTGLVLVALVAMWERAAFTGLTNFATPHRISAMFSSMHVGGGAIDGYLALTLPFCWWLIARFDDRVRSLLGLAILALAGYVAVVTFSRGLYLGVAASLALLGLLQLGGVVRERSFHAGKLILLAALVALLAFLYARAFAAGGYRTLAALLITLAFGYFVGSREFTARQTLFAVVGTVLLTLVSLMLFTLHAKGAYIAFALSAALAFAGLMLRVNKRGKGSLLALGFGWCLANCVFVALHWGGPAAMSASLMAVLALGAVVAANLLSQQALWTPSLRSVSVSAILALVFFAGLPIMLRSYFIGERVAVGSEDVDRRLRHWQNAWNLQGEDFVSQLFGRGLGRFPALFYQADPRGTAPGALAYPQEQGNRYVRLIASLNASASAIHFGQNVAVRPQRDYTLSFKARVNGSDPQGHRAILGVSLCEMLVLYSGRCVKSNVRLEPGGWQRYTAKLATGELGKLRMYGRIPIRLVFANGADKTSLDIDEVSLSHSLQGELVRNGGFTQAQDHWFFSVTDFWPWHVENTWLSILLETGWLGLISFAALMGLALLHLLRSRAEALARNRAVWLASLSGFVVVATLNSQFEFPRVALLFFLVLFCALLRPPATTAVDELMQRKREQALDEARKRERAARKNVEVARAAPPQDSAAEQPRKRRRTAFDMDLRHRSGADDTPSDTPS